MAKSGLKQLELDLKTLEQIRAMSLGQIDTQTENIRFHSMLLENAKKSLDNINHRILVLKESIFLEDAVPCLVRTMRLSVDQLSSRVKNKSITVAEEESLNRLIFDKITELQKTCMHPLVLDYDGYEGSYERDYENYHYGKRFCTVCHFEESSSSVKETRYKILDRDGHRLVKRDIRNQQDNLSGIYFAKRVWHPLPYLIEVFRRSAGDLNANWPVMDGDKMTDKSDLFKS